MRPIPTQHLPRVLRERFGASVPHDVLQALIREGQARPANDWIRLEPGKLGS